MPQVRTVKASNVRQNDYVLTNEDGPGFLVESVAEVGNREVAVTGARTLHDAEGESTRHPLVRWFNRDDLIKVER